MPAPRAIAQVADHEAIVIGLGAMAAVERGGKGQDGDRHRAGDHLDQLGVVTNDDQPVGQPGHEIAVIGSLLTIAIAIILFVAAIMIGIDGIRAYQRYRETPLEPLTAPGTASA